ncbi:TonB-dependent receptor [Pseudoalteromonas sp. MMG005]|uniref:TonB-dependent receptor domain-containing protein n=1 Tax=Pseudoalteromonas sp. MMG005 TaxID=2822682 RepID=UPI001B3A37EB|nr:TonB-dependent receptor [Pseudoalteromonas sp. MMG005]MBQ4847303.1 TonB-dependent receptor [Pseudoalteromonas sp. MMG005]
MNNNLGRLSPIAIAMTMAASSMASEVNGVNTIERVEVTSSRIKRVDVEGAINVHSISSSDMVRNGFDSVYDALMGSVAAGGAVLGEVETGSYTPGAKELNLRGLGPEYTLILVNGKRLAYYPMPFGGQTNFVNLDMIPTAMVERIDIQTGGASAIYGSDAMAGVVNIITKKGIDGHFIDAKFGQDTYGKGDKKSLTFVGGTKSDKLTFDYALEYKKEDALLSGDRPFHDSVWDNPDPDANKEVNRSITVWAENTQYRNQYSKQFCNTDDNPHPSAIQHFVSRNGYGPSCGWDETGDKLLRNESETYSIYLNSEYALSESMSLFANGFYIQQDKKGRRNPFLWGHLDSIHGGNFWDPDIENKDGGYGAPVKYMWRVLSDDEYTDDGLGRIFNDESLSFNFGLRGEVAGFYYSVGYSHANYDFADRYLSHTVEGNKRLKGPKLGEVDGMAVYRPNYKLWFGGVTADSVSELMDWSTYDGNSFNDTITADLSGDLFELPAGPLQFSAYIELMREGTRATPDSRILNKQFVGLTGVVTDGERDRYAAAFEFLVPITQELSAEAAVRYDYYDDASQVGGAMTSQLGLTYKPTEQIVIRSAFGTTFRGPDMSSLYQGFSGNFGSSNDRITADACRTLINTQQAGGYNAQALAHTCASGDLDLTSNNISRLKADFETLSAGDLTLEEETGSSFTAGVVYEYSDELSFNIDFYSIKIEDKIKKLDATYILDKLWLCENGGEKADSSLCNNMRNRVKRYDENGKGVDRLGNGIAGLAYTPHTIQEGYINAAERQDAGIDLGIRGFFDTEFGTFRYKADYNRVIKKKERIKAEDPLVDILNDQDNRDFKELGSFATTWEQGDTSVSWLMLYKGKMWNNAEYGERQKLPAWIKHNLTLGQHINDETRLIFTVKNLLNAMPPQDETFSSYPFYHGGRYDSIGREFSLRLTYQF